MSEPTSRPKFAPCEWALPVSAGVDVSASALLNFAEKITDCP